MATGFTGTVQLKVREQSVEAVSRLLRHHFGELHPSDFPRLKVALSWQPVGPGSHWQTSTVSATIPTANSTESARVLLLSEVERALIGLDSTRYFLETE